MHRIVRRAALPAGFLALLVSAAWVAPRAQDSGLTTHAVAGTVHYLESPGSGNIGVCVGADGVFVIDDKFANLAEPIDAAIDALSEAPVRFLLNTHWHGDHTGANAHFGAQGVPILAHGNVRARLAGTDEVEGRKGTDTPPAALPLLTYEDGITLHLNGERIDVLHFGPGHTDGDSIVVFNGSNVVHMGDLYFNGMFPYIDLDSGGSVEGYVQVVGAIAESLDENVKIIPGHGPLSDLATLKRFHAMLVETTSRVRAALAEGKDLAAIQAEDVLGDYTEGWSWQFIDTNRYLEILVRGLSGK